MSIQETSTVFLNGEFMPLSKARISPLDRGFLFGEGIYEVIPCYQKRFVGWQAHITRMFNGLRELNIRIPYSKEQLLHFAQELTSYLPEENQGLYIHVTRGAEEQRYHAYTNTAQPTIFMMNYDIPPVPVPQQDIRGLSLKLERDVRWQHRHIKSTALLGNVMHFQSAYTENKQETLLYDAFDLVTEASLSNVFFCKGNKVYTPPLGNALLPGVTRQILINVLRDHTTFEVIEENVPVETLYDFDEIWLTSSTKGISPVTEVDDKLIGGGKPGKNWFQAANCYLEYCFDY